MLIKRFFLHHYFSVVFIFFTLVMFLLPFISNPNYSLIQHTTSQLGAQGSRNAWVMNVSFAIIGLVTIIESWRYLKKLIFQNILLTLFGFTFIAIAFFQHGPLTITDLINEMEDQIHSILASLIGILYITFSYSMIFVELPLKKKIMAITIAIIITLLSFLMFVAEDYKGIWQRLIFLVAFGWLIVIFNNIRKEKNHANLLYKQR